MKILYVSYDGLTDPLGQSQVLPYLVKLRKLNYEITILSTEKKNNFLKNKSTIDLICENAGITWEFVFYTKTPPVLSTIRDVNSLKKKAKELHKRSGFSIVHCRSYIAALIGLFMKRQYGIKFLFDMRGFWADERVDGGIWNLNNPVFKFVYNYFKKKEKAFLLGADAIISLTYNGKNEIRSWDYFQGKKDNITVIPCCADLDHFNYNKVSRDEKLKIELGIPKEDKVLSYLGSVGTWYMLDEMQDYFKSHLKVHPKTSFLWITKDDPNMILSAAERFGIRDKIFIRGAERQELPSVLSICDASIFFIKPLFSKKASSPTKKAELLGMGVPIICNGNVGDTQEILQKENAGFVVNHFNDESYTAIAKEFETLCNSDKVHLRNVAKEHFSLEDGVKRYASVYEGLLA